MCLTNLPLLPGVGLSFSMPATCYPSATCSSQRLPRAPCSFYISRTEPYLGDIGPNFSNLLLLLTFSSFSSSPPFLLLYRPRACFAGDIAHHFSFSFLPSLLHFPSQQFEDNEAPPLFASFLRRLLPHQWRLSAVYLARSPARALFLPPRQPRQSLSPNTLASNSFNCSSRVCASCLLLSLPLEKSPREPSSPMPLARYLFDLLICSY